MQISSATVVRSVWLLLCLLLGCVGQRSESTAPVGTAVWQVMPAALVADGQQAARITLTVARPSTAPWAGVALRVLADDAQALVSDVTGTNAQGEASATVRCAKAGLFVLRAEVVARGLFWPLEGEAVLLCREADEPTAAPSVPAGPLNLAPTVLTDLELADPGVPVRIAWVVYDAEGRPLVNQPVTLSTLRPTDIISPTTAITDAEGSIQVTLITQEAGDATVVAQAGAVSVATVVQLGGTLPEPKFSRFVSRAGALLAAQDTTALFDLEIRDRLNRPVPQSAVELSSDTPTDVFSPPKGRTDAAGRFTTTLTRSRAGIREVTASAPGLKLTTAVRFAVGPAHASQSTLTVDPATATADPTRPTAVGVRLADIQNNPIVGSLVTVVSSEPTDVFNTVSAQTNADGRALFSLRSRKAGVRTLTAQNANTLTLTAPMTVLPGEPNAALSQLVASPNTALVGPDGAVALSALWLDRFTNPMVGQNVVWSGVQGMVFADTITATSSVGRAETTVSSTRAGPSRVTAMLQGQTLGADILFQPGAPAQAPSTLTLDTNVLTADAVSQGVVTVVLRDTYGNPVPNVLVSLSFSGAAVTLTPSQAQTSALGTVTATVTSQVAGNSMLTAQAGPLMLTAPLTLVAGPAAAARSTLTATPNAVIANGVDTATLTAHFCDAFGNPIPNQTVAWSGAMAPDVLSATTQVTNAMGAAQVTLSSSRAHTAAITATLGGVALQTPVDLVAGPAVAAQSSFVINPNALVIDGNTWADYTLTLADAWKNPASAQSINVLAAEPDVTIVQPAPAAAGTFQGQVRSTTAGTKTLTATADGVVLQQRVTFTAGAVDATTSTLTATPQNGVWANGRSFLVLSAQLADAWGNPAAARNLAFASDSSETFATPTALTDPTGRVSTRVTATTAGAHTLSAQSEQATLSVPVTFARAASLATSSLSASPSSYMADANTAVSLSLTARDAEGLPVEGAQVEWHGVLPGFSFLPSSGLTDAQGQANTQMRGASAGKQTAFARVTGLHIGAQVAAGPRPSRCSNTLYLNEAPWPLGPVYQRGVAAADLNHDGKMDVLALSFFGSVSVSLGLGDKLFADPVVYAVGPASTAFAVADLNDDGQPDAFALSAAEPRVYVLFGRPDGTLAAAVSYLLANDSIYMVVDDLNGDGLPDVVTGSESQSAINVLFAQPGGTLSPAVSYSLPAAPGGVATGPLVGPLPDIAVSLPDLNKIAILSQTAPTDFGPPSLIPVAMRPRPLIMGDFDGDGRVDLAIGFDGEKSCGMVLGQEDGSLGNFSKFSVPNNVTALSAFTPSGTGAASILATSSFEQSTWTYKNMGGTDFALIETQPTGNQTRSPVFVGDIDGDGTVDFLVPNATIHKDLQIIYRTQPPQASSYSFPQPGARHALVADFNQDGHLDLLMVNYTTNHQLRYGMGNGQFDVPISLTAGIQAMGGVVGDFDHDGMPDAAVINNDRTINIYLNPSQANTVPVITVATESTSTSITAADINDDTHLDILVANQQTDSISVFEGRGDGTFKAPQRYSIGRNPRSIVTADFNLDGLVDVAVANFMDGEISLLYNDGFGQFLAPTSLWPSFGVSQLAIGDFDGDGQLDIASVNEIGTKRIEILLNRGDHFLIQSATEELDGIGYVAVGDVDGDGHQDLLAVLKGQNAIKVFLNDGDASFRGGRAYGTEGSVPVFTTTADFTESGQDSIFVLNDLSLNAVLLRQTDCR